MIGNEHSAARNSEFTRNLMEAPKPGTNFPKLAWARGISPWINGRLFLKGKTTTPHLCTSVYVYVYIYIHIYIFLYDIGLYYILYIILSYRWYDISVETNHWLRDHFGKPPNFVRSPNWIYNSSPKKPVTTSSVILQGLSPHLEEEVLLKLLLKKSVHGSSVHHMHTLAVKKKTPV